MADDKTIKALELFGQRYNCAQAVFAAFAQDSGLDEETAIHIASAFGGGICSMRGFCGALSGLLMALGAYYKDPVAVREHFEPMKEVFLQKYGSLDCNELAKRSVDVHPLASLIPERQPACATYVAIAADMLRDDMADA